MDWIEIGIVLGSAVLLIFAWTPRHRAYRLLSLAAFALLLSAALFRRSAYLFAKFLPAGASEATHVTGEVFGIAWWILGAWLVRGLLTLVLRRTLFPNDNQPHARRLYADLASVLIYLIAFAGIMDTVLKEPISNVLATSGVLAILLGLALQSTLADVFSGLAINIEQPFGAGDWITLNERVEGQVIEINWRATHIRTASNDTVIVPNSVIAKAIVTNHRRVFQSRWCALRLTIDCTIPPLKVLKDLRAAAAGCPGIAPDAAPLAYACDLSGSLITYEVYCGVADFALVPVVKSELIARVVGRLHEEGITIGALATDVRILNGMSQMPLSQVTPVTQLYQPNPLPK